MSWRGNQLCFVYVLAAVNRLIAFDNMSFFAKSMYQKQEALQMQKDRTMCHKYEISY